MRDSAQKSYTAAVAVCVEVAMILSVAGIQHGLKADPTYARLNFTLWTSALLLFVSALGFVFLAAERYFSVIGKTQEYGVLRVLGASLSYIWLVELIEALAICVPATAAGIALTFLIRLRVNLTLREFLRLDFVITDCAIALGIVVIGVALGSGIGMMKALRDGTVQALSYEK
jgi:ABC-type antimicrobial peptide transport system permease subunit